MGITDELREWFDRYTMRKDVYDELTAIADRIDAEHQKAEDEWKAKDGQTWLRGYGECHAELMEGNKVIAADLERAGWVKLPKDADGVPIRIGDVMEFIYDPPQDQPMFEVSGFGADETLFYAARGEVIPRKVTKASVVRHHQPPTVEDVLREFAEGLGVPVADSYIAASAAKLQLKEEA